MASTIPIFLCGERQRGDDAAAFLVADLLPAASRAQSRIVGAGQIDALTLLDLPANQPCIVVDAVHGVPPGTLVATPLERIAEAARQRAGAGATPPARSSHELPLDQTLALVGTLRDAPLRGTFLGLGGAEFALGTEPSPAVAAALPAFALALAREIDRLSETEID
jgi:hydrogenase maturation protease